MDWLQNFQVRLGFPLTKKSLSGVWKWHLGGAKIQKIFGSASLRREYVYREINPGSRELTASYELVERVIACENPPI